MASELLEVLLGLSVSESISALTQPLTCGCEPLCILRRQAQAFNSIAWL